jgi:hypothetical protein
VKSDIYKFRIDSFTPGTLPMARLAIYLAELAKLLGNESSVHFREITRGSAVLVSEVEPVAVPKVRDRLSRAEGKLSRSAIESDETADPFRKLNAMLAADNAVGNLRRGTATILRFPGREAARVKIGPVTQPTNLVGQLVRIGGRDSSAHAQVEDVEGRSWTIAMTRDQARLLAPHLYGDAMRFNGVGRWFRMEDGTWELDEMKLHDWEKLKNETLRESVTELRLIEGSDWSKQSDAAADIADIREGRRAR